jgi:hypothetical protein
MASASRGRERMVQNFIRRYGEEALRDLMDGFSAGESGQAIADRFGVSRERVRQWKNAFGQILTIYQIHPEIQRAIGGSGSAPPPREAPRGIIELDLTPSDD